MHHFHCSVNYYPAPGANIEAASAKDAEAAYRKNHAVPAHIDVAVDEVAKLPNGSFQKVPMSVTPMADSQAATPGLSAGVTGPRPPAPETTA